jgi:hypothetical protein
MAATTAAVEELRVDDPGARLRWYFPVPEAGYGFCSACGSSLFWRSTDESRWSICAGTLDPPTGLRTVGAWWLSEASDYHVLPDVPGLARE